MIAVAAGVKVLVATKPVDFRKGADGPRLFERHCSRSHEPISWPYFATPCAHLRTSSVFATCKLCGSKNDRHDDHSEISAKIHGRPLTAIPWTVREKDNN